MSNEWNELVKEVSPHEQEMADKKLKEEAMKDRYIEKLLPKQSEQEKVKKKGWNYERKKLDKMLGWEKAGETYTSSRRATGKEEFAFTSSNTFERREKVEYTFTYYVKMRADKNKIKDLQKHSDLDKEISEFLAQAEEKLGATMAPAMFRDKECISYCVESFGKFNFAVLTLIPAFVVAMAMGMNLLIAILVMGLLMAGGVILSIYSFRKKNASYKPMIDAYNKKIKEFEEKIKEITLS